MKILEKTLEDIVFETDNNILESRGLYIHGKKKRQVRIGNYGIADIITVSRDRYYSRMALVITIIELKQDKINMSAFLQAIRYAKGIKRYLNEVRNVDYAIKFRIDLIGTSIDMDNGSFLYLLDLINSQDTEHEGIGLNCYIMNINIDGIHFEEKSGYQLINEGF